MMGAALRRWQTGLTRAVERETHYCSACDLRMLGLLAAENHLVFEHQIYRVLAREIVIRAARPQPA